MKKLITLIILIFQYNLTVSQNLLINWGKGAGGLASDEPRDIVVDNYNNVIVIGDYTSSIITFGNVTLNNTGMSDVFVVKYNTNGDVLWAKNIGGVSNETAGGISIDKDNNIYITGEFNSTNLNVDGKIVTNVASSDIFVLKLNSIGTSKHFFSIGGNGNEYIRKGIIVDSNKNLFLTGSFQNELAFSTDTLSGNITMFVAKFDSNMVLKWASNNFNITCFCIGWDMNLDNSNNIIIVGSHAALPPNYFSNAMIIKLDSNGNTIWNTNYGFSNSFDEIYGLTIDDENNYYLSGMIQTAGNSKSLFLKYNFEGSLIWDKSYIGQTGSSRGSSIAMNNTDLYLSGYFADSIMFDNITLKSKGASDIFISKLDKSGNVVWANSIGGLSNDYNSHLIIDNQNKLLLTSSFASQNININNLIINNTGTNSTGVYSNDLFIVKFNSNLTGVNNNYNNYTNIKIYPNPANDFIIIEGLTTSENTTINIYDIQGKLILTKELVENGTIDLSELNKGVYVVKIGEMVQRIVKM